MFLFLILKYCCLNLDSSIGKVSIFTDGRYLYMMLLFYYLYLWNIGRNSKICENSCEYQYRHVYGFPEFAKYIFGFVLLCFVVCCLKWFSICSICIKMVFSVFTRRSYKSDSTEKNFYCSTFNTITSWHLGSN